MFKIGLTGGIGSGKSTVAKLFAELGVPIIDADAIVYALTAPKKSTYKKIIAQFGAEYLKSDGSLDRRKLRTLAFQNEEARIWLENLIHPLVFKEIRKRLKTISAPYVILVIPLLFETKACEIVDHALVVDCPEQMQIKRIQERDHTSAKAVKAIIQSQIPRKLRLALADTIIQNCDSLPTLKKQVKKLHGQYLKISQNKVNLT